MTAVAACVGELLATVRKRSPEADQELVLSAYRVAARWHEGQTRMSGEAYVTHPLAVAKIVAELGLGQKAICAAILHDLLDDTPYTAAQMRAEFGEEVASLVVRLSDVQLLRVMFATVGGSEQTQLSQQDIELLVVKLADRLHNMRTLRHIGVAKQIHKSRETLEFVAPVAHRLGFVELKRELEDLALQVLRPALAQPRERGVARLLGLMALLLPAHTQQRWRQEWAAELSVLPGRRARARFTWQTLIGVPRLAWTLQRQRDRDIPPWTVSLARIARTLGITGTIVAVSAPGAAAMWVFGVVILAALGLLAALLFARSDAPSRRLRDLIKAFRGGYRATRARYPEK